MEHTAKSQKWNPYRPLMEAEQKIHNTRRHLRGGHYQQAKEELQGIVNRATSLIADIESMTRAETPS